MNKKTKLIKKDGFSLLESVVSLLIVLTIMVFVTIGINAANRMYRKSLFLSESEILASTIDIALSDILRYSSNGSVNTDGTVVFSNDSYHVVGGNFFVENGRIYINTSEDSSIPLLSDKTYSSVEAVSLSIDYDNAVYTGNYTLTSALDTSLSETFNFTFRSLS